MYPLPERGHSYALCLKLPSSQLCAAGFPYDERVLHQVKEALPLLPVEQVGNGQPAQLADAKVQRRQRRVGVGGEKLVVAARRRHILRYADIHAVQLAMRAHGYKIIEGDDCFKKICI